MTEERTENMTYGERAYGYKYTEGERLATTEIAKLIRADIKQAVEEGLLPRRWTYSVRSDSFANGTAIDVLVKGCADAWMPCPGYKVGTRREYPDGSATATACGDVWCKAGGQYKDLPAAQYHDVLTEEALAAEMTLERIHFAYNHDGSDISTDYFDVNYYGRVTFQTKSGAEWEAEEKAQKASRPKKARPDRKTLAAHLERHHRLNTDRANFDVLTAWHKMAHDGTGRFAQERHTDHTVEDLS